MRFVRLLFAYLVATPFAVAGLLCIVFIGTLLLGVLLLTWAGIIVAWGWWPFIPTGHVLVGRQQEKYISHMEAKEEEYPVEDIIPRNGDRSGRKLDN